MALKASRERMKILIDVTRLAFAFMNLLMAGAFAQEELKASDNSPTSEKGAEKSESHKESHKEHHEDEKNEDDPKFPRISPFMLYLYSKILLITVLSAAAVAFLATSAGSKMFGGAGNIKFWKF